MPERISIDNRPDATGEVLAQVQQALANGAPDRSCQKLWIK
jgi:hypothetical protein